MSGFEIVGAVAAADQFIKQGVKTIEFVIDVCERMKEAPESIRLRRGELETLQYITSRVRAEPTLRTAQVDSVLARCNDHALKLQGIIDRIDFRAEDELARKMWRASMGLRQEGDIAKIFDAIQIEMSLLSHLRMGDMHSAQLSTKSHVEIIHTKIVDLTHAVNNPPPPASSDEEACRRALFQVDPSADRLSLLTLKGKIVPGTCDWVLKTPQFLGWEKSTGGALWISGGPGMGKTMLSIHITEHLEKTGAGQSQAQDSGTAAALYFFCDNKDSKRNTSVAILRGILHQLLDQAPGLITLILPSYRVQTQGLFAESSFETLWRIFTAMVTDPSVGRVSCVLDGLDECDLKPLEGLLSKVQDIATTAPRLNLIIVSREQPEVLSRTLGQFRRIRLDPDFQEQVNEGLAEYISVSVAKLAAAASPPFHPDLIKRIEDTFREKSDGRFLWVSFVVKDLRDKQVSEVDACLQGLPKGLDEIYARMLGQISDDARRQAVEKILKWCTFAARPLELEELVALLGIESQGGQGPVEILKDQISFCGHFLVLEPQSVGQLPEALVEPEDLGPKYSTIYAGFIGEPRVTTVVKLVHQSAKEFLVGHAYRASTWLPAFEVEVVNAELAAACLGTIKRVAATIDSTNNTVDSILYPFEGWDIHARFAKEYFAPVLARYASMFEHDNEWELIRWEMPTVRILPWLRLRPSGQLVAASNFGLDVWVRHALATRSGPLSTFTSVFVNRRDHMGLTALHHAAECGHLAVIRLLVENGARIDKGDRSESALGLALRDGELDAAALLLQLGADANGNGKTVHPLVSWTALRNTDMAKLLFSNGADISKIGRYKYLFLYGVALGGPDLERVVLDLITEHGQSPTSMAQRDSKGNNALHSLCAGSDSSLPYSYLHVLLGFPFRLDKAEMLREIQSLGPEWGFSLSQRNKDQSTLLHSVVSGSYLDPHSLAELLANAEIDVDAVDSRGRTALHRLCSRMKFVNDSFPAKDVTTEAFKCLLGHGANISLRDHEGFTARDRLLKTASISAKYPNRYSKQDRTMNAARVGLFDDVVAELAKGRAV